NVDKRAREYLKSGQAFMAADVIFAEGSDLAVTAGRQVETARLAEHQASDREIAAIRKRIAIALGSAAAVASVVVLLLIPVPRSADVEDTADTGLSIAQAPHAAPATPFAPPAMFKAAAELATDFGRVRDLDELTKILGRAGDVMGASGLIVWMGSTAGAELRPVLFHGYSPEMIARIPPVPRSANHADAGAGCVAPPSNIARYCHPTAQTTRGGGPGSRSSAFVRGTLSQPRTSARPRRSLGGGGSRLAIRAPRRPRCDAGTFTTGC